MNVLVDTNVVIDVLLARTPFNIPAEKIITFIATNKLEGIITTKQITDIYYIIKKEQKDEHLVRDHVNKLFQVFLVVNTSTEACYRALVSSIHDYEDAILTETALEYKTDAIVTRNIKNFNNSKVKIFSPQELVDVFEKQQN